MTARLSPLSTISGLLLPFLFFGCGSAQKQRLELREKLAASSGMYCEFISGDVHSDIDVELNMQMAKRCEPTKPLSITNYKNSSENFGVIYCCSLKKDEAKKDDAKKMAPHALAPSVPAAVAKKNSDELDLSDDSPEAPAEKKSDKPALPPKTNPATLNNPAASSSKPSPAPATSKPASPSAASQPAAKPASSAAASGTTNSAASSAKASSPAAQTTAPQNSPKSPSKTPDTPETDILGE